MVAEGELRSNLDDSDRVRELQDKVAELKAEVCFCKNSHYHYIFNLIFFQLMFNDIP